MHLKHTWHSMFAKARESLKAKQLRLEIVNKLHGFHCCAAFTSMPCLNEILQNKKKYEIVNKLCRFHCSVEKTQISILAILSKTWIPVFSFVFMYSYVYINRFISVICHDYSVQFCLHLHVYKKIVFCYLPRF